MSQNIFSLEGLISWLEQQDPEQSYIYIASSRCLVFEYLKERGVPLIGVTSSYWRDTDHKEHWGMTEELGHVAVIHPHTYGAALKRAREALTKGEE